MNILVIHDALTILAWLINEPLEAATAHIANGYPELSARWQAEELTAVVLAVPEANAYASDLYEIRAGAVVIKEAPE